MRSRLGTAVAVTGLVLGASGCGGLQGKTCGTRELPTPCFQSEQNRPVLPGGAAVTLVEQQRASATCLNGWGDLGPQEPLRAMPLAALARDRGVTPQVSRVRVVVGPDVEGAAARTVTRYVLQVTGPVGETGSWVVTAPGLDPSTTADTPGVVVGRLDAAALPPVLRGCVADL